MNLGSVGIMVRVGNVKSAVVMGSYCSDLTVGNVYSVVSVCISEVCYVLVV